jgi:hypothetical protein
MKIAMFQGRLVFIFDNTTEPSIELLFFWLGFGHLIIAFDEYRLHGKQVLAFWPE